MEVGGWVGLCVRGDGGGWVGMLVCERCCGSDVCVLCDV